MPVPEILSTKLYVPHTRQELVPRPRLIERLNEGLNRKMTLLSAPAGFGKTTLVSEWIESLRSQANTEEQSEYRVAWLSLDVNDSDPVRFLTYLVATLRQIDDFLGEGLIEVIHSPQTPPMEDLLTSLINELVGVPDRIVLVLDDYHLITESLVDDAITFLIEHLPPRLHLVLATRIDPQVPLARLRVRDQLTELRATDLRFAPSEAAEFLNRVMGLNLSDKDIMALEARTEGWIAGLQLAALSMWGEEDMTGFVQSFTGSHRLVLDYLIEEVLEKQPADVQDFLLQTSLLDRLTGPLCDVLTGQKNGQQILDKLDQANLFIIPLDDQRRWYRYHHLFTDLLRQRLRQTGQEQVPLLHHRASTWCEENGFVNEAIEHALHGENFKRAANLIERHVDVFWQRGEHGKLWRWMAALPINLIMSMPHLCVFQAWNLFTGGDLEGAERFLGASEQLLDESRDQATETSMVVKEQPPDSIDRMKIHGRAATIRAFLASYSGDVPGTIKHARKALEFLPEEDLSWRSTATVALGDAHSFSGNLEEANRVRLDAMELCKAAGNIYMSLVAGMKLAVTMRQQGYLKRAIDICQQQIELANRKGLSQSGVTGGYYAVWGEVLAELDNLEEALNQTKKGVTLTEQSSDVMLIGWSNLCHLMVLFSQGDVAGAEEVLQKMERMDRKYQIPPWIMNLVAAYQVQIWISRDRLDVACRWAEERGLNADGDIEYLNEVEYAAFARILIAQGKLAEATRLLQQLIEAGERRGHSSRVIGLLILLAVSLQEQKESDQSITTMEQALTLAEPEGSIRVFVNEGLAVASLLNKALRRGVSSAYVKRLLAAFPSDEAEASGTGVPGIDQAGLIEPLSERELEVLQLIAEGLTNQEIANRLYLSLNTVKVHTRNIFGKLGVNNRTQAVAEARALGILSST
jgi:LuxR family maltose regulon positive regulatory protein